MLKDLKVFDYPKTKKYNDWEIVIDKTTYTLQEYQDNVQEGFTIMYDRPELLEIVDFVDKACLQIYSYGKEGKLQPAGNNKYVVYILYLEEVEDQIEQIVSDLNAIITNELYTITATKKFKKSNMFKTVKIDTIFGKNNLHSAEKNIKQQTKDIDKLIGE